MVRAIKPPENWVRKMSGQSPNGTIVLWENSETGEEITLPATKIPDEKTLSELAMSGVAPQLPTGAEPREFEGEESEPIPQTPTDRIMEMIGGATGEGRAMVRISKMQESGPDLYCGKFSAEEFEEYDLDGIRVRWGPGRYSLMVMGTTPKYDANGNAIKNGGKFVRVGRQVVEIVPSNIPDKVPAQNPVSGVSDPVLRILETLTQKVTQLETNGAGNLQNMLQTFQLMKGVFGSDHPPAPPPKTLIEQLGELKALRELAQDIGGGGDSEPSMMSLGGKLLEMVGPALAQRNAQPNPVPGPLPAIELPASFTMPRATPAANQPPEHSEGAEMTDQEAAEMKAAIGAVCEIAAKNGPVEEVALWAAENLPDPVIAMLEAPIWWGTLSRLYPEVVPHQEWFTTLRARVIQLLDEEPADDVGGQAAAA